MLRKREKSQKKHNFRPLVSGCALLTPVKMSSAVAISLVTVLLLFLVLFSFLSAFPGRGFRHGKSVSRVCSVENSPLVVSAIFVSEKPETCSELIFKNGPKRGSRVETH